MEAQSVVEFWTLAQSHGLDVCIDGGWAVDALLGRQTRPHADLDIALPASQGATLCQLVESRGFTLVARPDSWEHNYVYDNAQGQVLDVHTYELNPDGSNAGGVAYCAEHLTGHGQILGTKMCCVPPEWLVQFHTGYAVDANDWHDVKLLCERFDLAIPPSYARFISGK
ncbi:MAG: nucleotidyltransferase domain-containing protein [Marinosulfonomonas sp.]